MVRYTCEFDPHFCTRASRNTAISCGTCYYVNQRVEQVKESNMASLSRREFVKVAAALPALSGTSPSANPKKLAAAPSCGLQPYGTTNDRSSFTNIWSDWQTNPFEHQEFPAFHRLTTSLDALYSRCQQPVSTLNDRPVCLQVKILCSGEAGRTLFTLG